MVAKLITAALTTLLDRIRRVAARRRAMARLAQPLPSSSADPRATHHRPALSERLRAGPGAALLCESRSASGSRCDRAPGHTGLHGYVEIMRDGERTWPCAVYWADMIHEPAPRGLDPVTVDDGRTERVKRGAA